MTITYRITHKQHPLHTGDYVRIKASCVADSPLLASDITLFGKDEALRSLERGDELVVSIKARVPFTHIDIRELLLDADDAGGC